MKSLFEEPFFVELFHLFAKKYSTTYDIEKLVRYKLYVISNIENLLEFEYFENL